METRPKITIRCSAVLCGLAMIWAGPRAATAQTWEYSPYNIRLWVAVEPTPQTIGLADELGRQVARSARLTSGVVWRVFPDAAPSGMQLDLLTGLEAMTAEQFNALPDPF